MILYARMNIALAAKLCNLRITQVIMALKTRRDHGNSRGLHMCGRARAPEEHPAAVVDLSGLGSASATGQAQ